MHDRGEVMTENERLEIVNWVCANFFSFNMKFSVYRDMLDYTLNPLDSSVPMSIWRIQERIVKREGLQEYLQEPSQKHIIMVILPGGSIRAHTDPNIDNFIHTRFNVFVQLPKQPIKTFYGKDTVDAKERHYTMCRSGLDIHRTDTHIENVPRITLSFGYLIPREVIDQYYHKPAKSIGIYVEPWIQPRPSELQVSRFSFVNLFYFYSAISDWNTFYKYMNYENEEMLQLKML